MISWFEVAETADIQVKGFGRRKEKSWQSLFLGALANSGATVIMNL